VKIVALISRLLLGLIFLVFGLNGFLHFLTMPPPPPGPAADFMAVVSTTHYMTAVFALQVVAGFLFLINRFVPLALTLVGPVIVNILLFHSLMEPSGLPLAIAVSVLWLILFSGVRSAFMGLFRQRT
jgi:putative oxidoreductase